MLRVFLVFFVTSSLLRPPCCPRVSFIVQPHRVVRPVVDEGRSALRFGRRQAPCASLDVAARRGDLHLIDADVYVGTASWGGEVLFRFASLSSFPLILFCLALCTAIACNCTRGMLALCVQYFVDASALRRSLERCRGGQRAGCRRDGRKHGGNCTETGSFSHRPPRSSSRGEHVACRRTVPSSCAGGGGKTRPRKRQMQGKNVICNDLCAKSACISKKKPTFAVELSYYYCQPHHAKKITSFLHGAAHLGGGAHGGRPPQAQ